MHVSLLFFSRFRVRYPASPSLDHPSMSHTHTHCSREELASDKRANDDDATAKSAVTTAAVDAANDATTTPDQSCCFAGYCVIGSSVELLLMLKQASDRRPFAAFQVSLDCRRESLLTMHFSLVSCFGSHVATHSSCHAARAAFDSRATAQAHAHTRAKRICKHGWRSDLTSKTSHTLTPATSRFLAELSGKEMDARAKACATWEEITLSEWIVVINF